VKYRHRLTLYRPAPAVSDFVIGEGEPEQVAQLWAGIETNGGSEGRQGEGTQGRESVSIRFRWTPTIAEINSNWWVERDGKRFDFVSVANIDERNREVLVTAVQANG
jgi:head-tail adaptor